MTGPGTELNRGSDVHEAAQQARDHILGGDWIAATTVSPSAVGVLGLTMLPIAPLRAEPLLSFALDLVQPMQDIIDDLAGDPAAITMFGDAWQAGGRQVEEAATFLGQRVETDLAEWEGDAADAYRGAVNVRSDALLGISVLSDTTGVLVVQVGEAVAGVRLRINDVVVALVDWMFSTVVPAIAAAGTLTPAIVADTATVIARVAAEVIRIVQALFQMMSALGMTITEGMALLDAAMQELAPTPGANDSANDPDDPGDGPGGPDDDPWELPGLDDLLPLIGLAGELLAGLGSGLTAIGTGLGSALAGLLRGIGPLLEPGADPPVPGPGGDPGSQPGDQPGETPGGDPGGDPGPLPGDDPGSEPGSQPGDQPGEHRAAIPVAIRVPCLAMTPAPSPVPSRATNRALSPEASPAPTPAVNLGPTPAVNPAPTRAVNLGLTQAASPAQTQAVSPGPTPATIPAVSLGPNPVLSPAASPAPSRVLVPNRAPGRTAGRKMARPRSRDSVTNRGLGRSPVTIPSRARVSIPRPEAIRSVTVPTTASTTRRRRPTTARPWRIRSTSSPAR